MREKDDKYYIEKVLSGETASYTFLVDKYKALAFTLAMRLLKNRQDAEEAVQDAFLKAYRNLKEFRGSSSFSTWIYRIVYNTGISRLRSAVRPGEDVSTDNIDNLPYDEANNALNRLKEEDQKKYINAAISRLNEDEAFIITLYYLNESGIDEIGRITGLTSSNIKIKLFRARKKLMIELNKLLKDEVKTLL